MSFASVEFIVFFAAVLSSTALLERFAPKQTKFVFLLLASYFFYGWWDWRFCFLLLFVSVTAYGTARLAQNKIAFIVGVTVPLAVLGVFKYLNFFLDSVSALWGGHLGTLQIILPVGISFYTFQALSYVIDVRRGRLAVETNFVRLALYISFFPQLVAGPIVRASDFLPQLKEDRRVTGGGIESGLQMMLFGLFKKIVLADHISVFVDDIFRVPAAFHWLTLLWGVAAYAIQIYFDFSGYSDIAIGCAKCFGYDFKPNFDLPYLSASIAEFWQRWHISLSLWFSDYVYVPVARKIKGVITKGNRKSKRNREMPPYIALAVTFFLSGLWHGASWNCVLWGVLHAVFRLTGSATRKKRDRLYQKLKINTKSRWFVAGQVLVTFVLVCFTYIFFRADNFGVAWQILRGIFTLQDGIVQPFTWVFAALGLLLIGTGCAVRRAQKNGEKTVHGYYPTVDLDTIPGLTVFFLACILLVGLAFTGEAPFVYFQF